MKYDIAKTTAPKMPNLGKGTECIKLLLSQASKGIQEPLVPIFFPVLGAHISGAEFQYPDNSWKETTGIMANLVAKSGDNKRHHKAIAIQTNASSSSCRKFYQIWYIISCRQDARTSASISLRRLGCNNNPRLSSNNPRLLRKKAGLGLRGS